MSRGQAVEIGGGFRIPDVLRQSGAALVEVAPPTAPTPATTPTPFPSAPRCCCAFTPATSASSASCMKPAWMSWLPLAAKRACPCSTDLGSGTLLPTAPFGLAPEPTVDESVAAGADLVTFSGDKLLGGPQAGLIVGRAALVERLRRHPLARALRVDKATIAALEATLLATCGAARSTRSPCGR